VLEGSEKVIMIADEGIMEIVKNEKQPDSAKAQLRTEPYRKAISNTELEDKLSWVEVRTKYQRAATTPFIRCLLIKKLLAISKVL
jgi:hypothetical protein